MDTHRKNSYFLGWTFGAGHFSADVITLIALDEARLDGLRHIHKFLKDEYLHGDVRNLHQLKIMKHVDCDDHVTYMLNIFSHNLSSLARAMLLERVCYNSFTQEDPLAREFWRGFFEATGTIDIEKSMVSMPTVSTLPTGYFQKVFGVVGEKLSLDSETIQFHGCVGQDFLSCLYGYEDLEYSFGVDSFKKTYREYCQYVSPSGVIRVVKANVHAVLPSKVRASDTGFDLTVISEMKREGDCVIYYDTGIQVIPPMGYYLELVGRSSLIKKGYMLANNIGIIDTSYRGNLIVALYKFDQTKPDLELPARICQLIPRTHNPSIQIHQVETAETLTTGRGEGGFGSTG